jgi:hypothetical protein
VSPRPSRRNLVNDRDADGTRDVIVTDNGSLKGNSYPRASARRNVPLREVASLDVETLAFVGANEAEVLRFIEPEHLSAHEKFAFPQGARGLLAPVVTKYHASGW